MLRTTLRSALLGAALLAPSSATAATPELPLPSLDAGHVVRVVLAGVVPSYVHTARTLGAAVASRPARVLIALRHRDPAGLERFIARVSNPRSSAYGRYLTPARFRARFAPSAASVSAVEAFARAYGLHVDSVPSNRAYVYATGTVAQMERAFATRISRFSLHGSTVLAPSRAVSIPRRLAQAVTSIEGLDTADVARPLGALATPPAPAFVNAPPFSSFWGQSPATQAPGAYGQAVLPNVVRGYTPQQLQGAYGVTSAIAHGLDGRGQRVAVIDAYSSPTLRGDASRWSRVHRLPAPKLVIHDTASERDQPEGPTIPTDVPVVGGLNLQDPQGWFGEETLDVEAVHAMAPRATVVVQAAQSPLNVFLHMAQNTVVNDAEAQIVSNSYAARRTIRTRRATGTGSRPPPRASACTSPPVTTATRRRAGPIPRAGRSTAAPTRPT